MIFVLTFVFYSYSGSDFIQSIILNIGKSDNKVIDGTTTSDFKLIRNDNVVNGESIEIENSPYIYTSTFVSIDNNRHFVSICKKDNKGYMYNCRSVLSLIVGGV